MPHFCKLATTNVLSDNIVFQESTQSLGRARQHGALCLSIRSKETEEKEERNSRICEYYNQFVRKLMNLEKHNQQWIAQHARDFTPIDFTECLYIEVGQ